MKKIKIILVIFILVVSIIVIKNRICEINEPQAQISYVVQENDTLYSLANKNSKIGINEYIYKIKKVNNINSDIKAGQKIIIYK